CLGCTTITSGYDFRKAQVVFGERHLRSLLKSYQKYYNEARTHLSLQKDAPIPRAVQTVGQTVGRANIGRAAPPIYPSVSFRQGRYEPMFPGLSGIARNLRAFPRVQMPDVQSLSPAEVAIASILAAGLWALQTRSWRRPELRMKTARFKSTNRASRIGGTTRQGPPGGERR